MTKDEALKLALEALEKNNNDWKRLADSGEAGWWTAEETELYKQTEQAIISIKKALAKPEQEPVAWMNNKDFEPIRVRIMQEAYELADRNDSEGYNAIKVMCGDVQRMLPSQRTWVGLTDEEIDQGLLRSNHALQTAGAWRDGVEWATKQLKEKNT